MHLLKIEGGKPLHGSVRISGSKNAALPILIASLLTDEVCVISNVPDLVDIENTIALLVFLGKKVSRMGDTVTIEAGPTLYAEAPYELVRKMRASAVVLGPLLARLLHAKVSLPGGCAIGSRPINIHLDGFKALGAHIDLRKGYVEARAKQLVGASFHLDFPSVGATENIMMAAVLAEGQTTLTNAAKEPEIVDLAECLNSMGALIQGAGTDTIWIQGVKKLHGTTHRVIPDRIEAGTFLLAAAITGGKVDLMDSQPDHLQALLAKLRSVGADIKEKGNTISFVAPKVIKSVGIETAVYPGFPTDLQAQWMAYMSLSAHSCLITETVFENRFMHVPELERMGATIRVRNRTSTISGVQKLSPAHIMVSDLRAGAALVLAALAAKGTSYVHRIYHLDRGYENLEAKLQGLGASIRREKE